MNKIILLLCKMAIPTATGIGFFWLYQLSMGNLGISLIAGHFSASLVGFLTGNQTFKY